MMKIEKHWTKIAADALVGRTILAVEYVEREHCKQLGWYDSGLVLLFDNETCAMVQEDEEGNGPGALVIIREGGQSEILPTLSLEDVA